MGKSAIRILPPLVNGKLSGVLEFGVDYVEITEKIFKNEDFSFLVQIIWWGETKPLLLRPRKCKFIAKEKKEVIVNEQEECTVKYEVRTKLQLFKSYLTKCDEVELTILDSVKNEVIGSTFLKDLLYLVYNVECVINSIVSDTGDVIGKITCHFKFQEADSVNQNDKVWKTGTDLVPAEKWNNNDFKINLNEIELHLSGEDLYESNRTNRDNRSARNFNVHYNSPVTRISELTFDDSQTGRLSDWKVKTCLINADSDQLKPLPRELDVRKSQIECADSENYPEIATTETAKRDVGNENKKSVTPTKAKTSTRKENEITNRSRNSKVTNKKTISNNVKGCIGNKFLKNKPVTSERTVRGVKKDRATAAETAKNSAIAPKCNKTSNFSIKSMTKQIGNVKTIANVSNEISKINKLHLNALHTNDSDLENIPIKERAKDVIDNSSAEGNEKKLTTVITPPCEHSESAKDVQCNEKDKTDEKHSEKINVNNKLFFDLNDPIEKVYYETFFRTSETFGNNEFEIAELLNQPRNNCILETNPSDSLEKHLVENKLQKENDSNVNRRSLSTADVSSGNDEDGDGGYSVKRNGCDHESAKSAKEYKTDCHRCKYYKKLSELDKIIEALKNFESKLRNDSETVFRDYHDGCGTSLPGDIVLENENSDQGDVGVNANGSDYSKEDSDFVEFRRYLSQR